MSNDRQSAIDQLNAADAEAARCAVEMGAAAKAFGDAQQAADAAWIALLERQNAYKAAQVARMRARLMLIGTPVVPAADPMGSSVQA